jgi:hypothetical protein
MCRTATILVANVKEGWQSNAGECNLQKRPIYFKHTNPAANFIGTRRSGLPGENH